MKSWSETIRLSRPPREIRLVPTGSIACEIEQRCREREQASHERGRREGEQALSQQLVRQRAEVLELQNGVLESLRQAVPQLVRECENGLIDLALEVAQKLVAGLPVSAEMVEANVREAMAQVEETTEYFIQLNPADLELLRQVNSPLLLPRGGMDRLHFQSVPTVSRGGCILQTRFGTVDARRETKVELLRKSLQP